MKDEAMNQYSFEVVFEPDEDGWRAYCPLLEDKGAATWAKTKAKAEENIHEVLGFVIEELIADGIPIPDGSQDVVQVSRVAVSLS